MSWDSVWLVEKHTSTMENPEVVLPGLKKDPHGDLEASEGFLKGLPGLERNWYGTREDPEEDPEGSELVCLAWRDASMTKETAGRVSSGSWKTPPPDEDYNNEEARRRWYRRN